MTTHILILFLLMLSSLFINKQSFFFFFSLEAAAAAPKSKRIINPQIVVMGMVYCDICSNNTFSTHSYFLPGVQVKVDCTFKANSPRTTEQIQFSVNRTTNRYGIYKLEIPSVDGIECAREKAIGNSCRASLLSSSSSDCNVPGYTTTSDEIAIKSRKANTCIYSLGVLNFRPSRKSIPLCGK